MYSIKTRCIHGEGHTLSDANCAVSFPIYQTACFSHLTPGHNPSGFDYSRESNPTRKFLEETVSSLEGAYDTVAFASGMAAISAFFDCFRPGDHILCGEDLYGGVVRLIDQIESKNDYRIEYVDTTDLLMPFVKGDKARSDKRSSGLGLAIASTAAAQNGFTLKIDCKDKKFTATIEF